MTRVLLVAMRDQLRVPNLVISFMNFLAECAVEANLSGYTRDRRRENAAWEEGNTGM